VRSVSTRSGSPRNTCTDPTGSRVFVANAGSEEPFYEEPFFSGGPDRAYNQFYAAVKAWGHYETLTSPADADVLFEIGFSVPRVDVKAVRGVPVLMAIPYDPQFRLVIRDAKTNALMGIRGTHGMGHHKRKPRQEF